MPIDHQITVGAAICPECGRDRAWREPHKPGCSYKRKRVTPGTTDEIPMVLKGWQLHAELDRENREGLREGLVYGAGYATVFWLFVAIVVIGMRTL